MNKIYKVVWNKAKNCYVVASEFAKNHQTGSSRIKAASVAAVMAATMLTIGTGVIYAAEVDDTSVKSTKETILFDNKTDQTTNLNDPNLKHNNPYYVGNGHTDKCGELTYNTTLTIGDINKVADALVANDKLLYYQDIKNVTMKNGTISLMRNDNRPVEGSIALTGNGGKNGEDTSVTVTVGNESQTFQTGSVVRAIEDTSGKVTGFTINGTPYNVMNLPVHIYNGGKVASGVYASGTQIAKDMTISNLQFDFGDGLLAQEVGSEGDKRVLVTLDKDALKDDPDFKGPKGDKGDKGDTGATGAQGPQGEKGDKGDTGATGAQGPQGEKGDKGDTGATGAQGPQGEKGDKGDTGATGAQGPQGEKGDKGDTGAPGKDGGVGTVVGDDTNIGVENQEKDPTKPANYKVSLNKEITVDKVTAGKTAISSDGLTIAEGPSVTQRGINAGDKKITNVADGIISKGSKDAINGGQLYNETRVAKDGNFVKQSNTAGKNLSALDNQVTANTESIYHMNGRISDLDNRVNKVGAGAAALAALHPLDFDPDAKWDFAAGYGNYRGANAAAVGAYYRPNEDTMFSVGGTFGNGENMVNVGVSFKLGSGSSHVSTTRVAMAKEIKELRGELEAMKSAMLDANAGKKIDTSKLQLFPDVPQNHWAYEYVAQLAGDSMIEGYPDGNFAGDRPMTRYEFAAILYRAMTKGAVLSDKILSEFSHELEYFTVDTIAKDKAGNPTIQRVRIVKENKNK